MYDAIVIGSGLSAVSAALKLRPLKILMLDVGLTPPVLELPSKNIYQARREGDDLFKGLIGSSYEAFQGIDNEISPKLKGPQMRYFWECPQDIGQDTLVNFNSVTSYARGGLANGWGAGVMRYTDKELQRFPICQKDLDPYYTELTKHIGITGEADDLEPFFGSAADLLSPLSLSPICYSFLARYKNKKRFFNQKKIIIGRSRPAIISQKYRGRPPYQPFLQDFFQGYNRSIYNPAFTVEELCAEASINYRSGILVTHFLEEDGIVKVFTKNLLTSSQEIFYTQKLFIGAGAINTSKIVLQSFNDYTTKLPLLDNPVAFIPFLNPFKIGSKFSENVYPGAELIAIHDGNKYSEPIQASIYGLYGPMRSDLIAELPLSFRSNITAIKCLGSALGMMQVFFPDEVSPKNYLQLQKDGSLKICHEIENKRKYLNKKSLYSIFPFLEILRKMNYIASVRLCKFPIAGSSIHYAGSLPMKKEPCSHYETDINGRLSQAKSVYIIDAANFSYLPSKNHSFTMMANAMRIAENSKK